MPYMDGSLPYASFWESPQYVARSSGLRPLTSATSPAVVLSPSASVHCTSGASARMRSPRTMSRAANAPRPLSPAGPMKKSASSLSDCAMASNRHSLRLLSVITSAHSPAAAAAAACGELHNPLIFTAALRPARVGGAG
eukprot:620435-Prymnesium_polylepis.1